MTKAEAIAAMQEGKKVTHRFFLPTEFIKFSENGSIETEEGYLVTPLVFWSYRREPYWETDWELYDVEEAIEKAVKNT